MKPNQYETQYETQPTCKHYLILAQVYTYLHKFHVEISTGVHLFEEVLSPANLPNDESKLDSPSLCEIKQHETTAILPTGTILQEKYTNPI